MFKLDVVALGDRSKPAEDRQTKDPRVEHIQRVVVPIHQHHNALHHRHVTALGFTLRDPLSLFFNE